MARHNAIDWTELHQPMLRMIRDGLSLNAIADRLGVGPASLWRYMKREAIPKPRGKVVAPRRTPEAIANQRASALANGHFARLAEANRARRVPDEHRQRISAALKAYHARCRAKAEEAAKAAPYRGIVARTGLGGTAGRATVAVRS